MKTPNLWQKLVGAFKKPTPKKTLPQLKDERPTTSNSFLGWSGGGSVYRKKKGTQKLRKKKNRLENRARATQYRRVS